MNTQPQGVRNIELVGSYMLGRCANGNEAGCKTKLAKLETAA